MTSVVFALCMLLQASSSTPPSNPPASDAASTAPAKPSATTADPDLEQQLVSVKRIYVDHFGDDSVSKQLQAMIVSRLTEEKRFIVTENKERADAILRGSGLEKTSQELHSYSEGTSAGDAAGEFSAAGGTFGEAHAAIRDSGASTETIDHATVAVRLLNRDGDVLWATTQESKGAKYKGATADVAEKVVKELLRALNRLEKKNAAASAATPSNQ